MTHSTQNPAIVADDVRGRVSGGVLVPDVPGYDEQRIGFQLRRPHRPDVVVAATGEDDVREAVRVAASRGARVAVQATGHGVGAPLQGGMLISTGGLCGVRVDPRSRTAWVEAGASWQQVIDAAAVHGLTPLSGSFPGLGAVSYTLGGGIGLMARRYGFAADHVRRIDVVTPDGRLRRVSAERDPDLFWALRGGGGNFGVVTGMEIDLMPVSRFVGGGLFFDVDEVPDVLERWRRWTATVPDEVTSAVSMLPFPDVAAVPEALRGRRVAQVQVCCLGSLDDARQWVEPLRAVGPRLRDTLRELAVSESAAVFDEPDQPHAYVSRNVLVSDLGAEQLEALSGVVGAASPVMCVVGLRHLGGALARPPEVANAVGHRRAAFSVGVLSPVTPDDEQHARGVHRDALVPFSASTLGPSLNFSFGALDEDEVRAAFAPADFRRLAAVKADLDPTGMLHCNHPIPPIPDGV